ncbi:CpaF/VirB11 family protein [Kitasatospora sp. NPDC002551]|uniref:CpaF family protein n=1 Tax=Kitasatospora sp. NPDC002551 TaxID=3154539 RepID=UPI003328FF37
MSDTTSAPAGSGRQARFRDALLAGQAGGSGWSVPSPGTGSGRPAALSGGGPVVPGPVVVEAPGTLPVPYEEVVALRRQVAERLAQATADKPGMSQADLGQLGQSLVTSAVGAWATDYAATSRPLSQADEQAVRVAVYEALFQAGRLQPLLNDPDAENIVIDGDEVWVDYRDRPRQKVAPVADSDDELIELVNTLVRTQGQGERALTSASPLLNTRLRDGSRLAAVAFNSPRPHVVIRRHRTRSQGLADLRRWGTIDPCLEAFLAALVKARKNVIIAGSQGVGKTSLLRAMAREIPPTERIGTIEGEYELWLHTDPHGPSVLALEGREGNGERDATGRNVGEVTLTDLFRQSLRMSLRRVLVGEVRGAEVLPMLHAMQEGEGGSMATVHARSAAMTIERLVMLAMEAGTGMTDALAYRVVANAIDFVIYLRLVDETAVGGARHRFVAEVVELTGVGEGGRPSRQTIFGPREDGGRREPRAVPIMQPQCIGDLVRAGLDPNVFQQPWGRWEQELRTVTSL